MTIDSTNLCKSCNTKGCIFQFGIKREKCDFYTSDMLQRITDILMQENEDEQDEQEKECCTCYHYGEIFRGYGDRCYDPCEGCKENGYKNYRKEE